MYSYQSTSISNQKEFIYSDQNPLKLIKRKTTFWNDGCVRKLFKEQAFFLTHAKQLDIIVHEKNTVYSTKYICCGIS